MAVEPADLDAVNSLITQLASGQSVAEYEVSGRKIKYQHLSL